MSLRDNLLNRRIQFNLTQKELAIHSDVNRSLIARIETGHCVNPKVMELSRIAKILDITIDELLR